MSNYNKILAQFIKIGMSQNNSLDQYAVNKAMDRICKQNGGPNEFDRDVAQELWEHCQKDSPNTVILKDYIQCIMEAQNVLKEHLKNTERQINSQQDPQRKQELQNDLVSYAEDCKLLTVPFKMGDNAVLTDYPSERNSFGMGNSSRIFADRPSQREQSTSLKLTFLFCLVMMSLQIFVMFHKHHFYNILVLLTVLAIVILNYFDKTYIKFCMINLAISIFLDLLWMVIYAKQYWFPEPQTQHSTIQTGYLTLVTLIVIIMMLLKLIMIILIFRFRDNPNTMRKVVNLCKLKFQLDGQLKTNPVSLLIEGNSKKTEN